MNADAIRLHPRCENDDLRWPHRDGANSRWDPAGGSGPVAHDRQLQEPLSEPSSSRPGGVSRRRADVHELAGSDAECSDGRSR